MGKDTLDVSLVFSDFITRKHFTSDQLEGVILNLSVVCTTGDPRPIFAILYQEVLNLGDAATAQ
jgi:hypothetical protein